MTPRYQNQSDEKEKTALLSVIPNTMLVFMKVVVGLSLGSVSIISEAIHSGMDLLASLIAFFFGSQIL